MGKKRGGKKKKQKPEVDKKIPDGQGQAPKSATARDVPARAQSGAVGGSGGGSEADGGSNAYTPCDCCGEAGAPFQCPTCGTGYCDEACQHKGWKRHKKVCAARAKERDRDRDLAAATTSSTTTVRGVVADDFGGGRTSMLHGNVEPPAVLPPIITCAKPSLQVNATECRARLERLREAKRSPSAKRMAYAYKKGDESMELYAQSAVVNGFAPNACTSSRLGGVSVVDLRELASCPYHFRGSEALIEAMMLVDFRAPMSQTILDMAPMPSYVNQRSTMTYMYTGPGTPLVL